MDTNNTHDEHHDVSYDGLPTHHDVAYDRTDISARGILKFLIAIAIVGVVIHFVLWGSYRWLSRGAYDPSAQPNPLVTTPKQLEQVGGDPSQKWPEPRLQPNPTMDMDRYRELERELTTTYGWNDKENGVARIPVSEAMKIIAQQGLPTRPQPQGGQSQHVGQPQGMQPQSDPKAAKSETGTGAGPSGNQPAVKH